MADEQTTPAAPSASAPSSSPSASPSPSPAASPSASTPSAPTQSSPAATTTEPVRRPAYIPETHWDAGTGKVKDEGAFAKFVNDHVAFKAAEDSRRLTLPQKPEDYQVKLPKDFQVPQGVEFVPNENDPLLPQARAFAKEAGLSQDQFEKLIGLKAAIDIGSRQLIDNAKAAEVQKLGATGTARKTAVDTWLMAELGDDLGKEMSKYTFSAKQVEGFEKLIAKSRTQGAGSYDPRHGEISQPGKVTDEEYNAMSFSEKREYAAKFGNPTAPQQANGR